MAPKKLTEADKKAILGLYRQPEETTSTLAERYGVSNSTISRLLKASLPEAEYSALIQQKRLSSDRGSAPTQAGATSPEEPTKASQDSFKTPILKLRGTPTPAATPASPTPAETSPTAGKTPSTPTRRVRSRSQAKDETTADRQLSLTTAGTEAELLTEAMPLAEPDFAPEELESDLAAAWEDDDSPLGDDYEDDEDEDEEDDEAWDGEAPTLAPQLEALEIYPLTAEDLPSLCYLVVERTSSELVALPLRTFASLGQIPEAEGESRTLPVFDNHRVARRFSRRNQRVIKVPDGALLQTTRPYLQAKGITRLLIDGQVFALEEPVETSAP
ncbi:MAG TPA: hypothetical protein IGR64_08320 [Leptolyngbyaceae cyanobacterium M65_K2018_010]|nr:hypothetical protein [Leptolyngbyaceae cyanobacterium M65_K2018_010]